MDADVGDEVLVGAREREVNGAVLVEAEVVAEKILLQPLAQALALSGEDCRSVLFPGLEHALGGRVLQGIGE